MLRTRQNQYPTCNFVYQRDKMEAQDGNTSPAKKISYIRPSDRSPEKDFHSKDDESKINACLLRSSVNKARQKINNLRDEVEKREKEIEIERKLRTEAESRLEAHLQDMYKSPEVNQELRERLPRANKSDPLRKDKEAGDISESTRSDPFKKESEVQDTEESSIEEQIIVEVEEKNMSHPKMKPSDTRTLEAQIIRDKGSSKSPSPRSSRKHHDHHKGSSQKSKDQNSTETQTQPFSLDRSQTFPFANLSPSHGFYGHAFGATSFMPYPGNHLSYPNPLLNATSLYQQNTSSAPVLNSSLNTSRLEVPHIAQSLSSPLHGSLNLDGASKEPSSSLKSETQTYIGGNTSARSGRSLDSGLGSNLNIASSGSFGATPGTAGTSLLPDPFMLPLSPRIPADIGYGAQHNRQIASLLNELDAQRADCKKMKEKLAEQDKQLETLKLTLKARDPEIKSDGTETAKAAGIVEEVYAAQKKRDEASLGRMKLMNQEKEDVIERLRDMEKKLEAESSPQYLNSSNEDIVTEAEDMDQENLNLLLSVLDSPSASDTEASSVVRRMELIRQRQKEMINEEMQVIMEQRDAALARCRKLEAELLHYQRQEDGGSTSENSLKAKLATIKKERDLAIAKSRQLDDEIQKIRLYYSLHKSLSQEESLKQQANNSRITYETQLKQSNEEVEGVQKENNRLVAQLRTVTIEKKQLAEALEIAKNDKEKLQRLATVLRKKLNAMNNTPRSKDQKEFPGQ